MDVPLLAWRHLRHKFHGKYLNGARQIYLRRVRHNTFDHRCRQRPDYAKSSGWLICLRQNGAIDRRSAIRQLLWFLGRCRHGQHQPALFYCHESKPNHFLDFRNQFRKSGGVDCAHQRKWASELESSRQCFLDESNGHTDRDTGFRREFPELERRCQRSAKSTQPFDESEQGGYCKLHGRAFIGNQDSTRRWLRPGWVPLHVIQRS